ncbi:MAG: C10 family peptidase [Candidatus Cloacimonadota bacterium]|nr:C10 family peptidase [Candidatus Cloacimonadota bacterium]
MKRIIPILIVAFLFANIGLLASPITQNAATEVAEFKISLDGKTDFSINNCEELLNIENNRVGFIFHLTPQGFVLVSTDTDLTPIAGISYRNNFSTEDVPSNIAFQWLRKELSLHIQGIEQFPSQLISDNNQLWNDYLTKNSAQFNTRDRAIYPPEGTTTTGGWVETQWNQNPAPYNAYCPLDPNTGGRSYVGCVATAMIQIINYHRFIGDAEFYNSDDYNYQPYTGNQWCNVDNDYQSLDFPNFPNLNLYLDLLREEYMTNEPISDQSIAALGFAAGVSVEMCYSTDGSGAYSSDVDNAFLYKFDYDSALYQSGGSTYFYSNVQDDMMDGLPIHLSLNGNPGHAIVLDGYNSAADTYHLNFGWGGSSDGWYDLPDGIIPMGFTSVSAGIIHINGGFLPYLSYKEIFASETIGDYDGRINPGETADVRISIQNKISFSTATDIVARLRCNDPRVIILDSIGTYSDIPAGSAQTNITDPFKLEVVQGAGACTIDLTLHVESNDGYSADLIVPLDVTMDLVGWPVTVVGGVNGSPAFVDFDGSGTYDVVFGDNSGKIHRFDIEGNEYTGFPYDTQNNIKGSVAISDIDGNGEKNIICGSNSNELVVLEPNGDELFTYQASMYVMVTPTVADIDGNGSKEIIFQSANGQLYVIDSAGNDFPNFPIAISGTIYMNSGVAVADINGNGNKEIIAATLTGDVSCINKDAEVEWTINLSSSVQGAPTIIEFSDETYILVGDTGGRLAFINSNGNLLNFAETSGNFTSSPLAINLSGGSTVQDLWFMIGSQDGTAHLIDYYGNDHDGWPNDTGDAIYSTPIVADVNNNGIQDFVFGSKDNYLYGFGVDGEPVMEFPIDIGYQIASPPAIIDADGDGDLDIAFGSAYNVDIVDYKTTAGTENILYSMYRFDLERTGFSLISGGYAIGDEPPAHFTNSIAQNFPNPVQNSTKISYSLKNADVHNATLKIYNILGQQVSQINNLQAGSQNSVDWNATDKSGNALSSGIYFYRIESNTYKSDVKKMILMR